MLIAGIVLCRVGRVFHCAEVLRVLFTPGNQRGRGGVSGLRADSFLLCNPSRLRPFRLSPERILSRSENSFTRTACACIRQRESDLVLLRGDRTDSLCRTYCVREDYRSPPVVGGPGPEPGTGETPSVTRQRKHHHEGDSTYRVWTSGCFASHRNRTTRSKENELLVRVHATSVNYGDLLARNFRSITYQHSTCRRHCCFSRSLSSESEGRRSKFWGANFPGKSWRRGPLEDVCCWRQSLRVSGTIDGRICRIPVHEGRSLRCTDAEEHHIR